MFRAQQNVEEAYSSHHLKQSENMAIGLLALTQSCLVMYVAHSGQV